MFVLRSIWRKVASRLGIWRVVSSFPGFGRGSRCYQVARDMSGRVPATARGRTKNGNYHTSQRRFSRTGCVRISFFFFFLFVKSFSFYHYLTFYLFSFYYQFFFYGIVDFCLNWMLGHFALAEEVFWNSCFGSSVKLLPFLEICLWINFGFLGIFTLGVIYCGKL